jgi:malate dehydrogenase
VANPANTNALVLKEFAPTIPAKNITCLTRLDHNRALGQISEKLQVDVGDVKNAIVWGNHSSTQFPDASHATVKTEHGEKPVSELVADQKWYFLATGGGGGGSLNRASRQHARWSS